MSRVHVYLLSEKNLHDTERGADCRCEPRIIEHGVDSRGERAIVFVHKRLRKSNGI